MPPHIGADAGGAVAGGYPERLPGAAGKPVVRSLQAGHSFPQVTLPLGACLRMEAERKASADENVVSGIDESIANIFVL